MSEKKEKYLKIFSNFLLLGVIIFVCIKILPYFVRLFAPFIIAYIITFFKDDFKINDLKSFKFTPSFK